MFGAWLPSGSATTMQVGEEVEQIIGVLLLDCEDVFQKASGRDVLVAEPTDDVAVRSDSDAFGDEVLLDHRDEVVARVVLGVGPIREARRVEVR